MSAFHWTALFSSFFDGAAASPCTSGTPASQGYVRQPLAFFNLAFHLCGYLRIYLCPSLPGGHIYVRWCAVTCWPARGSTPRGAEAYQVYKASLRLNFKACRPPVLCAFSPLVTRMAMGFLCWTSMSKVVRLCASTEAHQQSSIKTVLYPSYMPGARRRQILLWFFSIGRTGDCHQIHSHSQFCNSSGHRKYQHTTS